MRLSAAASLVLAYLSVCPLATAATGGDVDPSFAYSNPAQAIPDSTNAVGLPDGGLIVIASRPDPAPATSSTLDLARIDANGAPAAAFGAQDGRRRVTLPLRLNVSHAATLDAAGNILLGGYQESGEPAGSRIGALLRLDAQGVPDSSFGNQGVVLFDAPAGHDDRFEQVEVLPDGRIVAGVQVTLDRLVPDWNCDTGPELATLVMFDTTGHAPAVLTELDNTLSAISACANPLTLKVQPDGEILVGNQVGIRAIAPPDYTSVVTLPEPAWDSAGQADTGPFLTGMTAVFVDGDFMRLYYDDRNEPNRGLWSQPGSDVDPPWLPLAFLAGFDNPGLVAQMLANSPFGVYVGFTDGVNAGVAAFQASGAVRTDWGGGDGVTVLSAPWASGGAGSVRKLFVQPDGHLVVVTSSGLLRRILPPSGIAHGGFALAARGAGVAESDFTHTLRVSRTGGNAGAVSVEYRVAADCDPAAGPACFTPGATNSATAGEDFEPASGELFWADGDTSEKTIQVRIKDDKVPEVVEYLFVQLRNPTGGAAILAGTREFPINTNDQLPPPNPGSAGGGVSRSGGGSSTSWLLLLLLALSLRERLSVRRGSSAEAPPMAR